MNLQELLGKTENDLKLRNYSSKTIKSYLLCLNDYFVNIACLDYITKLAISSAQFGFKNFAFRLYVIEQNFLTACAVLSDVTKNKRKSILTFSL